MILQLSKRSVRQAAFRMWMQSKPSSLWWPLRLSKNAKSAKKQRKSSNQARVNGSQRQGQGRAPKPCLKKEKIFFGGWVVVFWLVFTPTSIKFFFYLPTGPPPVASCRATRSQPATGPRSTRRTCRPPGAPVRTPRTPSAFSQPLASCRPSCF